MFAMTTTQAFWILDYDAASAWQIDCGKGVYFGISFWNEHLYVAARQARVGGNRDEQDNVILRYKEDLRLDCMIKPPKPIRDAHQITAADGVLYVASSYDDEIACYEIETGVWTFWQPFKPYSGLGLDAHHINSIFVTADEIFLAGLRPRGWVARFEQSTRKLISRQDLGTGTHNVWLDGGLIHVCSSNDCTILREDRQSLPASTAGMGARLLHAGPAPIRRGLGNSIESQPSVLQLLRAGIGQALQIYGRRATARPRHAA